MKLIVFAIIPIILLIGVGTSIMVNSSIIDAAEEASKNYEKFYEYDESGELPIGDKTYNSVEDYLNE